MAAGAQLLREAGDATRLTVRLITGVRKPGLRGYDEWRGALLVAVSEPASNLGPRKLQL